MSETSCPIGKITSQTVLQTVRKLRPYKNERYNKADDIAFARLFADVFRDYARYNATAKTWYSYDGVVWKKDDGGMQVEHYAKLLARALLIYSADVQDMNYIETVTELQERRKRETLLKDARSFRPVKTSDFDTDPYLLNCRNCVIDLKTGKTIEHSSDLLLSKVTNVDYQEGVRSVLFESFIDDVMCSDAEKADYLKRIIGYSLTGENSQEELYMCYGSTTRNGKSTLLDTMEFLLGDYAAHVQPESLESRDRNSRNASGDIARLDGVRLVHCSEPPKRMRLDVALLKTLTGRDVVTARFLHESEFQFVPVFKLLINTNFLPLVTDDTLFSSGRVKIITFDRHFTPEEQDIHLKTKLKSRDNLSGILNWCLDGLREYMEDGETLRPPKPVILATEEYRDKSDKLKSFMSDCFIPVDNKNFCISLSEVYEVFAQWCEANGLGTDSKANFADDLRSRGVLHKTGTIGGKTVRNVIKGYSLDRSLTGDIDLGDWKDTE